MYQIIADSSAEINPGMLRIGEISFAPFKITIDEREYADDSSLDIGAFYEAMRNTKEAIRTACPSPQEYLELMNGDHIFIVTITSELSGSYQSAMLARSMYLEKNPGAKVHVFDSKAAVSGETGVVMFLDALISLKKSFDEIVEATEAMIKKSLTIFALASLTNLARNGRIPKIAGRLSRVLNIRIIARAVAGKISPLSLERGLKNTLNALVEKALKLRDPDLKVPIVISQANDIPSAEYVRDKIRESIPDREIEITGMKGLSSTYAEEGGIVVFI